MHGIRCIFNNSLVPESLSAQALLNLACCPADWSIQHADLLPGCASVQPICVQPDGGH